MHLFDIICACIALIFMILGIKRGFVEEVIRVVAVVGAFFAALSLYRRGEEYIRFLHVSDTILSILSFLVIFLACLLAIALLGILIKKIVHLTVLGWVDRLCGGILGFVKVFFIVWIVVITVSSLPFDRVKNWFRPSKAYSFFVAISPVLRTHGLVPASGPVQDILKANPLPAITKAIETMASVADSTSRNHKHSETLKKPARPVLKTSPK
jgi:membrane protein required for colicin V production